jgi:ADP-ribose 1''-phosphate phosphatase
VTASRRYYHLWNSAPTEYFVVDFGTSSERNLGNLESAFAQQVLTYKTNITSLITHRTQSRSTEAQPAKSSAYFIMSTPRDGNIKSYFQATGEATSPPKTNMEGTKTPTTKAVTEETIPKPQNKLGKRPHSIAPPVPVSKRPKLANGSVKHLAYNDLPSDWLGNIPTPAGGLEAAAPKTLQLTYHTGDMFANAPKDCLLIHACNTQGHWGAGIAKAFQQHYLKAYIAHHNFCAKAHSKTTPVPTGTAQLLAPVDGDSQHWIGCLFTSAKYGKAKDKMDTIVKNTITSMQMLLELVKRADGEISEIRMCKINSGMFGVPWEKTEGALESIVLQEGWRGKIAIWEP